MPRGESFPGLEHRVEWLDRADRSQAAVHTASSGDVLLVVQQVGRGWRWHALGWLGITAGRGNRSFGSRDEAKRAVVQWWGEMSVADREQARGRLQERSAGCIVDA